MDWDLVYNNGLNFYINGDYGNARNLLEQIVIDNENEYRKKALIILIKINLNEGKYALARKLLDDNKDLDQYSILLICGKLELIEYNYNASKDYYNQGFNGNVIMQHNALLYMANVYMQLGDYAIAEKMFETLLNDKKFGVQAIFGLMSLSILKGDYDTAYKLLLSIKTEELSPKLLKQYNDNKIYILNLLGELDKYKNQFDSRSYLIPRLLDSSNDELILAHIARHKRLSNKMTNGCFFQYLDLESLYNDTQNIILQMHGNHYGITDMYMLRLLEPIGYKGNELTTDICVTTFLGTKDIVTIHPVSLSDKFDSEGFSKKIKH